MSGPAGNWKDHTRGCAGHCAAGVIYLQFPIQVRFSATSLELLFPSFTFTLLLLTMNFENDLHRVKVNYSAKCLHQRPFCSTVLTNTQTYIADRLQYPDHKVLSKNHICNVFDNWLGITQAIIMSCRKRQNIPVLFPNGSLLWKTWRIK